MKIALITGATSGIGEACARRFAEGGYSLILTARRADKLAAVKAELEAKGTKVLTLVFDVRDAEAAKQAVDSIPAEWQKIDVLINNAGLALGLDKEYEGDPEDWNTMIDTNIKGLHCLGDSSGWTRGLMMASVMGVLMGRKLAEKEGC